MNPEPVSEIHGVPDFHSRFTFRIIAMTQRTLLYQNSIPLTDAATPRFPFNLMPAQRTRSNGRFSKSFPTYEYRQVIDRDPSVEAAQETRVLASCCSSVISVFSAKQDQHDGRIVTLAVPAESTLDAMRIFPGGMAYGCSHRHTDHCNLQQSLNSRSWVPPTLRSTNDRHATRINQHPTNSIHAGNPTSSTSSGFRWCLSWRSGILAQQRSLHPDPGQSMRKYPPSCSSRLGKWPSVTSRLPLPHPNVLSPSATGCRRVADNKLAFGP